MRRRFSVLSETFVHERTPHCTGLNDFSQTMHMATRIARADTKTTMYKVDAWLVACIHATHFLCACAAACVWR